MSSPIILTEEQQEQYTAFVANFLRMLHEHTTIDYDSAEAVLQIAVSVLLGVIFCIPAPTDKQEEIDPFLVITFTTALQLEFGGPLMAPRPSSGIKTHD